MPADAQCRKTRSKKFGLRVRALFDRRNEELNLVLDGDCVEASNGNGWGWSPQDPIAAQKRGLKRDTATGRRNCRLKPDDDHEAVSLSWVGSR